MSLAANLDQRMEELTAAQKVAVELLSQKFWAILPDIYANVGDDGDKAALAEANARYDAVVKQLEAIVGEDGPCHVLDPDKWEVYHNVYKSEHGIRPRHTISRREVDEFLEPFRTKPEAPSAAA